ncbi:MAG TPA: hypothetical protein VJP59_08380 [Gemmatimonadota bacterium]|nr:hypothetical protein [Gemmatimonadota bacterium]
MPASPRAPVSSALFALGVLVSGLAAVPAHGQDKATIYASVLVSDNALAGRPVMVSFIRDGAIFFQEETITTESPNVVSVGSQDSPAGVYDVRVEGDGIVTEMKRGVTLAGPKNMTLNFVVRPGQGVHVVEYATGGLAREEVAQKIAALEAAVAELKGGAAP